jgi:hypothetical protein
MFIAPTFPYLALLRRSKMFNSFGYQRGERSEKMGNVINMSLLWSEGLIQREWWL